MPDNTTTDWKSKFSYAAPRFETCKVGDKEINFYAITPRLIMKLRSMGSNIAAALGALMVDTSKDTASKQKTTTSESDGVAVSDFSTDAIDPRLAEIRARHKEGGFRAMFDAVVKEENINVLAEVVMCSMRDEFPPCLPKPKPEEFLEFIEMPMFTEMFIGMLKANKGVLGPVGEAVGGLFNQVVNNASEKAAAKIAAAKAALTPAAEETPINSG